MAAADDGGGGGGSLEAVGPSYRRRSYLSRIHAATSRSEEADDGREKLGGTLAS
jgi:hypothetical protein